MSRILLFAISFITLASCQSKNRKIQEVVQKAVAQSDFNGLLYIEQNGEVLFNGSIRFTESELAMPNEDTPIYLASLSKVFTESAALQLHDNGLINLSSSISDQGVNEHQQFGSLITPHHLLEMRSGLPREFSYGEEFAQVIYDELDRAGPFLDTLPDFELSFTPRSDEEYSNLNYWILGSMIEEVTDANPDRAFYDLIFDRLSMRSSGLVKSDTDVLHGYIFEDGAWAKDDSDYSSRYASGGFYSSMNDLIALSKALESDSIFSDTVLNRFFGDDGRKEVYGSLPSFSNVFIKDRNKGYTLILLNNTGLRDLMDIPGLVGMIEANLGIEKLEAPRRVVQLEPISVLSDSITLYRNFAEWIEAVERYGEDEIFQIIDRSSVPGSMAKEDRTWADLSSLNKTLPNFRALGYRWVRDKDPKGIEVWFGSDEEGKIAIRWILSETDSSLVENVFIMPDDITWQGKSY